MGLPSVAPVRGANLQKVLMEPIFQSYLALGPQLSLVLSTVCPACKKMLLNFEFVVKMSVVD
jgi:hypothetical protein